MHRAALDVWRFSFHIPAPSTHLPTHELVSLQTYAYAARRACVCVSVYKAARQRRLTFGYASGILLQVIVTLDFLYFSAPFTLTRCGYAFAWFASIVFVVI